jgi:hypothetical protein
MTSSGKTLPKPRTRQGESGGSGRGFKLSGRLARQRRPVRIIGSAIFVGTAALANMYFIHSFDRRVPVVVAARDVHVGQQISRTDLTTARVAADATVQTIPERQMAQVIGQRAALTVRKGMLLAASAVTTQPYPGPGRTLVTVPLKTAMVPPGLSPGWQVRLIPTLTQEAGHSDAPAPEAAPPPIAAVVDQVSEPSTEGTVTVSLVVAEGDSPAVSRQAAPGNVALIVTAKWG